MQGLTPFFRAINRNKHNIMYSIAYLIAIIIGMTIIHEAAHFIAALAIGVPLNEIKLGLIKGNPGITLPDRFSSAPLAIVHYAGGFSAAAVLISIYFILWFRRHRLQPSRLVWVLGFITLGLTGEEIGNAVVEGRFHAAYIYYVNSPFSVGNILIVLFAILGCILHLLIFELSKYKKKSSE